MIREQATVIPVDGGVSLEAVVGTPSAPVGGVVIAHPHPLYGGDMDNPVVVRAAEVCRDADLITLRFNFRGVGRSTGSHDGGQGEQADVEAAIEHVAGLAGGPARVALVGYSFGAVVVAAVAGGRPGLAGVALIAPPLGVASLDRPRRLNEVQGPVLVLGGSDDEYCPRGELERLAAALPRAELHVIEGSGHFFFGKLYPLGQAVAAWAGRVAAAHA